MQGTGTICSILSLKRDLECIKGIFSLLHVLCQGVVFNQLKFTCLYGLKGWVLSLGGLCCD